MKKVLLVFILFLFSNTVLFSEDRYCVQIAAYPVTENSLSILNNHSVSNFINSRDDCILDLRGNGKYYSICCGDFATYDSSLKEQNKIRKIFKSAFSRKYNTENAKNISLRNSPNKSLIKNKVKNIQRTAKKHVKDIPHLKHEKDKEKLTNSVDNNIISKSKKMDVVSVRPKKTDKNDRNNTLTFPDSSENDYLSRNIANNTLSSETENFSLKKYLGLLLETDPDFKSEQYSVRLYIIQSLLEGQQYKPNIYFNGNAKVGKNYSVTNASNYITFDAIASINLDWHFYDAQKKYFTKERKEIFERLAKLHLLEAKDRLILYGLSIYMDMWFLQKIVKKYDELLDTQEKIFKIVKKRAMRGMGGIYDSIDSQNIYYKLELNISDLKERYVHQDVIFRESIDLPSDKPLNLYAPVYNKLDVPVIELQKEAIGKNKELAKLKEKYNLAKSDILIEAAKKGWTMNIFSHYGYGYSRELEGTKQHGNGFDWQIGINAKLPLYPKEEANLLIEKRKIETKKAGLLITKKIKTLINSISKIYNSIKKLKYKENIYNAQNELLFKRLQISYKRFLKGEGSYQDYSNSLQSYIDSFRAKLVNESLLHTSMLQLYILTGRDVF